MFKDVWNNAIKIKKYNCIDYEKIAISNIIFWCWNEIERENS